MATLDDAVDSLVLSAMLEFWRPYGALLPSTLPALGVVLSWLDCVLIFVLAVAYWPVEAAAVPGRFMGELNSLFLEAFRFRASAPIS